MFILLHAYEAESNHTNFYIFIKQYWLVLQSTLEVLHEITIFLGSSRTALLNPQSTQQSQLGKNIHHSSLSTHFYTPLNGEAKQVC